MLEAWRPGGRSQRVTVLGEPGGADGGFKQTMLHHVMKFRLRVKTYVAR